MRAAPIGAQPKAHPRTLARREAWILLGGALASSVCFSASSATATTTTTTDGTAADRGPAPIVGAPTEGKAAPESPRPAPPHRAPTLVDAEPASAPESKSAREPAAEAWVRYTYANDLFAGTDLYFTQGMTLTWTDPWLTGSPLALPVLEMGEAANQRVLLAWRYDGFTPDDFDEPEIQEDDRPFASYMLLSHRTESLAADGHAMFWAQWSLGYLGPGVGARQFQAEIHRHTDGPSPRGWRNQLDHDLVAQVEAGYAHRLLRLGDALDAETSLEVRLGTLYTDAALGARLRLGWLGSPAPLVRGTRLYAFAGFQGRAVGYNATLQGGVLNESVHTLPAGSVERVVAVAHAGLALEVGTVEVGMTWCFASAEFDGGRSHAWGQIALTVRY